MNRLLVAVAVAMLLVAIAQVVILWRYVGAREAVIGEAERIVVRRQLDQEGGSDG